MTSAEVIIDRRFRGPPDSGNGGYVAGLVARHVPGAAEITLRQPPPLDRTLTLTHTESGAALHDGDRLIAEGRQASVELNLPSAPGFEEASAATARYPGFKNHAFPGCFVCGPERLECGGLRIFPGPLAERDIVAAPWIPDASLADANGRVAPEFLWAALDCPGGFAFLAHSPEPLMLGRLAAQLDGPIVAGERCVVMGWRMGEEGRKRFSGTALVNAAGAVCGVALATWIQIKPPV